LIGFLLSELSQFLKNKCTINKQKKAIENKLLTNKGFIQQKIDILEQLMGSLKNKQFLDT